jgi:hypothetical protein
MCIPATVVDEISKKGHDISLTGHTHLTEYHATRKYYDAPVVRPDDVKAVDLREAGQFSELYRVANHHHQAVGGHSSDLHETQMRQ